MSAYEQRDGFQLSGTSKIVSGEKLSGNDWDVYPIVEELTEHLW